MNKIWLAGVAPLLLSACMTVPAQLQGAYVNGTPSSSGEGQSVRWGGKLVRTTPMPGQTCFEILSRPLGQDARPLENAQSTGRFTACASGFYDPEEYRSGKDITVVGVEQGRFAQQVGRASIMEPHVMANSIYIWPPRPIRVYYDDPYWMGPYPWGWGGPWYGYPYRSVYVVRPYVRPAPPPPPHH